MYSPHSLPRRRRSNKERERNLVSSVLCMLVIALLATALAQPNWFYLRGGACPHNYLGVYEFFNLEQKYVNEDVDVPTPVQRDHKAGVDNCTTPHIIMMIRVTIAFCFLGIVSSLFAFILDTVGVSQKTLRMLRRNAVASICTVFFCVTVIGLSYYISTLIERQQEESKSHRGMRIEVKFDVSFYLVTAAGSIAVLATAANLLRRPTSADDAASIDGLLDDYDGLETFSVGYPAQVDVSPMHMMPPPPPYTP